MNIILIKFKFNKPLFELTAVQAVSPGFFKKKLVKKLVLIDALHCEAYSDHAAVLKLPAFVRILNLI